MSSCYCLRVCTLTCPLWDSLHQSFVGLILSLYSSFCVMPSFEKAFPDHFIWIKYSSYSLSFFFCCCCSLLYFNFFIPLSTTSHGIFNNVPFTRMQCMRAETVNACIILSLCLFIQNRIMDFSVTGNTYFQRQLLLTFYKPKEKIAG